ncbi:BglG family transcription antiterminator [Lactovum odontotermitis]
MKKKELLLDYLKNKETVSYVAAAELAKVLGVTTRSVRYYVRQLNEESPEIILSHREGYQYNQKLNNLSNFLENPENLEERRFLILRQLLKKTDEGIDLFDISEELQVSDATIRADIAVLKKQIQKFHISIVQHDFSYYLVGKYEHKKALIIDLIQKRSIALPALDDVMQKFLGEISLPELSEACYKIFAKYDFQPNHYFFQNFLLHLTIALNQQDIEEEKVFSSSSFQMVEEISAWIFENYDLTLSSESQQELALLLDGERQPEGQEVKNYVDEKIEKTLKNALKELSRVFMIDFRDPHFLTRLLLHTQNLYNRAQANRIKRNLSTCEIKAQYPMLFDVAVYLSALIKKDLKIEIPEDEIAFMALHIGSFLDEQNRNVNKIKAALVVSDYLGRKKQIEQLIETRFETDLIFISEPENAELVISTDPTYKKGQTKTIIIREFLTERDFSQIGKGINQIKKKHELTFLENLLPCLILPDAFVKMEDSSSKTEVFEFIGSWFWKHGFVEDNFTEKLQEREKMSSTVFTSGIAIPHTIEYVAEKTGIMLIKPEKNFNWHSQKVELVLALAVNPADSADFNRIFSRLIELLVEPYHVHYLRESQGREELIQRLLELMLQDEYFEL